MGSWLHQADFKRHFSFSPANAALEADSGSADKGATEGALTARTNARRSVPVEKVSRVYQVR